MALVNYFNKLGIECHFLDTYEYISHLLAKSLSDGYSISTTVAAKPYSKFYRLIELRKKNADDKSATSLASSLLASRLVKFMDEYVPDVIICTHCLSAAIVDVLKQKGKTNAKAIGIVTDFTMHPFWEESIHFEYIVTPNELLNLQAFKKGFKKDQILPFGIPIDPKFAQKNEFKATARKKLGLDPNKFTILLMSGSMGYGDIEHTVSKLDEVKVDFQTITVCGNNAAAKEKIDEMEKKKTFLTFGYVDTIDQLMDAADCIITKPGGLTTSEALAKNLPIIITNPIPGQEDRNTEFLLNNGVAMKVSKTCPLEEIIYQFFYYTDREINIKRNISLLRRPNSTRDLCDFVSKLK
jgi:UDP-N-acetylglucosamine:LPS N-acetylglucosamine transferase